MIMDKVPDEIISKKILPHCSAKELCLFGQSCKRMTILCNEPSLWLALLKTNYPRKTTIALPFKDWSTPQQYRPIASEEAKELYINIDKIMRARWKRCIELMKPISFEQYQSWQRLEDWTKHWATPNNFSYSNLQTCKLKHAQILENRE